MKKLHYAWAVCLGCALFMFVSAGLTANAFSVVQPYILAQNGFTNTQTSMIMTVRSLAYLGCMFLMPWYYRLFGYRRGAALSVLLAAAAFALFALADRLYLYYLAGLIAGLCGGFGSIVAATILITRWFHEKHGLALGVCAASTGLATVIFSPILTELIERFSLAVCFWALAGLCLLLAAAVWLLLRDSPESCGKTSYGVRQDRPVKPVQRRVPELHRAHWALLLVAACLMGGITTPGFTHVMILFTTSGVPTQTASLCISIFGVALMLGKCAYGESCDLIGSRRTNWLFGGVLCAGLLLCALSDLHVPAFPFAASILFGLGIPIGTVGLSVWAEDFTNAAHFDWALRLLQIGSGIGALLFSFMPGMIADTTGSYAPAYFIFLGFMVFILLVVQGTYYKILRETARQEA